MVTIHVAAFVEHYAQHIGVTGDFAFAQINLLFRRLFGGNHKDRGIDLGQKRNRIIPHQHRRHIEQRHRRGVSVDDLMQGGVGLFALQQFCGIAGGLSIGREDQVLANPKAVVLESTAS